MTDAGALLGFRCLRAISRMALIALALTPLAARAIDERVAVIPLSAPAMLVFSGRSLSEAITDEARKGGQFTVIGPKELDKQLGRDDIARLIECGVDPACLVTHSALLKVNRIIAGVLGRTDSTYRVHIVHIDVAKVSVLASIQRDIPIASRRLKPDVLSATPALLRGEAEATGTLVITTEKPGARVLIDDEAVGETPLRHTVKPGKHKVAVSQEDYIQQEPHYIDVPAGGIADDKVKLYPVPATGMSTSGQTTTTVSKPMPLWPGAVSAALGAGALAWGGVKGLQIQAFNRTVIDKNGDRRFDVTRRAALANQSSSRMANGLLIGGGAAMALGIVLITLHAVDTSAGRADVLFVPGGAMLAGTF